MDKDNIFYEAAKLVANGKYYDNLAGYEAIFDAGGKMNHLDAWNEFIEDPFDYLVDFPTTGQRRVVRSIALLFLHEISKESL